MIIQQPKPMTTNIEKEEPVVTTAVELIDPVQFVLHPKKQELQLPITERSPQAKDASDNAWKNVPKQIVPITYTHCIIDGVLKMAVLDGWGRVLKAIENKVPLIPAIRQETDGLDDKEILKLILTPNHNFHISLLEIGRAASLLHKEYAPGQGKHNSKTKGEDIDGIIAGLLGHGLKSSKVKKSRLVYEADPEMLRKVDNRELKSLAAAYNSIKKPKVKKSYADGEEFDIETTAPGINKGTPIVSPPEVAVEEAQMPEVDNARTLLPRVPGVSQSEEIISEENIPEIILELALHNTTTIVNCPCCNKKLKITTV